MKQIQISVRQLFIMILLLLGVSTAAHAVHQIVLTGRVTGQVFDNENKPLSYVHVGIIGTRHGTTTDDHGRFTIEQIPLGNHSLGISMVGFEDHRENIQIRADSTIVLKIILRQRVYHINHIIVAADRLGIFEKVPGSLTYIDSDHIKQVDPVSGNEILRRSPGVHVVDEEGLGLRTNIGIRGLDPDRSRSVLVLEDGIPVSLAPYGEPEMYYTPAMDRMSGLEILKGSGSILYGPQTIGGVINYITSEPPLQPAGNFSLRGARGGFLTGLFSYGSTWENTGYQVSYLRKQADSVGVSSYRINDLSARFRFKINKESNVSLKIGVYDETSNSTYIGITQTMYDIGGLYDYARIAPDDKLNIRRYSMSLTHNHFFSNSIRLTTLAYGYTTSRNWQRQDFAYNSFDANGIPMLRPSNFAGIIWGDEAVAEGAIYMRNSTGNRNRQFEVAGLESRLTMNWMLGSYENDLTVGGRILYERALEQRINGAQKNAASGNLQEDEMRTGYGLSSFVHNQIIISPLFSLTAGVRLENFHYERDIRRGRFQINGQLLTRDTLLIAGSSLSAIIPGAGFNAKLGPRATLFGGIHKGFAPPRVKDAISNEGYAYELDAENSWNYELGIRQKNLRGFSFELTAFFMNFSNQIIPVAESAGGPGAGAGLINGGKTLHKGIEAAFAADIGNRFLNSRHSLVLDGRLTYVHSEFGSDRYVFSGTEKINIKGYKTPYAPAWMAVTTLSYNHKNGFLACLTANYTGDQYTDVLNTSIAAPHGRTGLIDSFLILDGNIGWKLPGWGTTVNISARNITNERYIVTRRPQGIRLGLPRMITAGVKVDF